MKIFGINSLFLLAAGAIPTGIIIGVIAVIVLIIIVAACYKKAPPTEEEEIRRIGHQPHSFP